jgi:hypothetical protein
MAENMLGTGLIFPVPLGIHGQAMGGKNLTMQDLFSVMTSSPY